ncbi:hypothetical protein [Nostoc sp.]|uniref:hypothetical protein n=1 Tax=Nostoc sp. TaxID=1180 RepID=UPI002FF79A10
MLKIPPIGAALVVRSRTCPSQFIAHPCLGDRKLESLVKNLFRPSYGGNRNFTLMYTLGHLMGNS